MEQKNIQAIIAAEVQAVQQIPLDNPFAQVVALIYEHVHKRKAKVIFSGLGKAGQVAQNLASTFSSTGTPSVFLHPSEAQHGDLGLVHKEDILLLISNSGKTRELLELVHLTHSLHGKIPILVITGNKHSPLAHQAHFVLHTGGPQEVCPLGLTPTTSITTMLVIGHILTVLMIKETGFSKEAYFKRHHGGYLGSVLKNMDFST